MRDEHLVEKVQYASSLVPHRIALSLLVFDTVYCTVLYLYVVHEVEVGTSIFIFERDVFSMQYISESFRTNASGRFRFCFSQLEQMEYYFSRSSAMK